MEERVFSRPAVKKVLKRFVCVRLDGRESAENRALKIKYGPVVIGNVQNRIVSPSGENLAPLPTHFKTAGLVDYLRRWLALYPCEEEPPAAERPLPYFATLHQALNIAACDARVLVVVVSSAANPQIEGLLRPLAWDPEFSGRFHFVRASGDEEPLRRIRGVVSAVEGAYLVIPDEFGMKGTVSARLAADTPPTDVIDAARMSLRMHAAQFEPRTLVEKFQRHRVCGERDWFYPPDRQSLDHKEASWRRESLEKNKRKRRSRYSARSRKPD